MAQGVRVIALSVALVLGLSVLGASWLIADALGAKWRSERRDTFDLTARQITLDERRVAIEEARLALEKERAKAPAHASAIPEDLESRINAWEDDFAKDQERQNIRSLYAIYADWDAVRKKLPPLEAETA